MSVLRVRSLAARLPLAECFRDGEAPKERQTGLHDQSYWAYAKLCGGDGIRVTKVE